MKGNLQFLFIAPERLRVPGFPEMLAKRKPSLIAIDEAHCISQWGHDFRPDYRMLGQYLPSFRPAPALALTATATPLVQKDIATQLGLATVKHFIHGFRRENIGIEIVEALPSQRPGAGPGDPARSRQSPGHCVHPHPQAGGSSVHGLGPRISRGRLPCRARCPTPAARCRKNSWPASWT